MLSELPEATNINLQNVINAAKLLSKNPMSFVHERNVSIIYTSRELITLPKKMVFGLLNTYT